MVLHLALELGKFPHEVEEIQTDDFDQLIVYMIMKADREKKAIADSKAQSAGGQANGGRPMGPTRRLR